MKKVICIILSVIMLMTPVTASASGEEEVMGIFSDRHNVKNEEIHPELRLAGRFIRFILPQFTERFFNFANLFLDNIGLPDISRGIESEVIYIERDDGSLIRTRIYYPRELGENVPGLLWIHGGGYALGVPETEVVFIEDFVKETGCFVVAPDYTNSPTAPYPAAFDDCYTALLWLKENGHKYGMRSDQIFVGGDSAGGGLCAAVCLKARDTGDVNIAFQMPLYPMLDDRMITPSSQNNDAPLWNTASNETAWKLYLGELYGTDNVPTYASPARETDYSGLPPTLTYIGDIEPFYDETVIYVENLRNAGVAVHFKVFPGCFHGFDLLSFTSPSKQAHDFLLEGFIYASLNYFA